MAGSSPPTSDPGPAPSSGTYVHVGTNVGAFAVGDHAHVSQVNAAGGAEEVLARLELALRQLVAGAATHLDSAPAEEVGDDAGRVAEEARRKRPDWDRITQLLGRITTRVGSVALLLEAVERVKDLLEALPH